MMTTMNVTPAEVHEIGLKEVERITAEMTKLAQAQGYKDLASFREGDQQRLPSGSRQASNRSWMTFPNTSTRWSRSCRSFSGCCRNRL
jgi:hypothetical protein